MTNEMIMQKQLEEVLLIMAEKGLIPYKDGNEWCILLGENIQEGICGFGYTIIDAMMDFYREATAEGIIRREGQKPVKDKIIEDTISYLNGGMCFNNSIEELKYRSNLAYGLNSLHPQPKQTEWSEDIIRKAVKEVGLTQNQIDWFKTNVFPPKQEWSEDDEKCLQEMIRHIEHCVTVYGASEPKWQQWLNLLKTLKNRGNSPKSNANSHSWKPTEEQMEALKSAVKLYKDTHFEIHHEKIVSLYEQLKKLREE